MKSSTFKRNQQQKKDDAGIQLWTLYAPGELRICFNITTATPKTDNSKCLEKKILSIHSVLATCITGKSIAHASPSLRSSWSQAYRCVILRYIS